MPGNQGEIKKSTIRSDEQYQAMKEVKKSGGCIWCMPEEEQKSKIIFVVGEAVVRKNAFPKKDRDMYIIHPKRHVPQDQMTRGEMADIFEARNQLIDDLQLPGGGIIHRFGDPKLNASSTNDDHYFEMVVVPHSPEIPVSETLVKDRSPEKEEARRAREKGFKD